MFALSPLFYFGVCVCVCVCEMYMFLVWALLPPVHCYLHISTDGTMNPENERNSVSMWSTERSHIMKNTFSLVSTYISWSSLSLPNSTMKKANESCIVAAAHLLVKRRSNRLFRFSSFCFVKKGEMLIGRPLRNDRRYPRGGLPSLRWSSVC